MSLRKELSLRKGLSLKKGQRGQSLVEVTLALPVLLLILAGILDVGRAYFTFISLFGVI